jgi:hypothetical protein
MSFVIYGVLTAAAVIAAGPLQGPLTPAPSVQITAGDAARAHYEVLACADPDQRGRLLVGVMAASQANRYVTEAYLSTDSGTSWQRTFDADVALNSFDPTCAYGRNGRAYFLTIGFPGEEPRTNTTLFQSADGGRRWTRVADLPRSVDRPYLTVDRSGGPLDGALYIHGKRDRRSLDLVREYLEHLWIARSRDGGATVTHLDVPSLSRQIDIGRAVVLSDGTFVTVLGEIYDLAAAEKNAVKVVRLPRDATAIQAPVTLADWSVPQGTNTTRSFGLAAAGDRLVAVWEDARVKPAQIMLSTSTDGGATWTKSRPLVAAETPAGGFNPAVAVNADGVIGVMWSDKRDHPADLGWTIRFTAGLDAEPDGAFRAVWIDNRTGIPQAWTTRVVVRPAR